MEIKEALKEGILFGPPDIERYEESLVSYVICEIFSDSIFSTDAVAVKVKLDYVSRRESYYEDLRMIYVVTYKVPPSFIRPYNNDFPYPDGYEIKPPKQLDPLLTDFKKDNYVSDVYRIFNSGVISNLWLHDYIVYLLQNSDEDDCKRIKEFLYETGSLRSLRDQPFMITL
ncbi:hypothetical protein JXM67_06005 [candidate division WOR-3 bacterium]|nr:hypothetical protein [candidate division WOR-3 bacterium]